MTEKPSAPNCNRESLICPHARWADKEIERLTAMWTAEITVLRGALNAILDMEGEEDVTDAAFAKEALRHARSALGD